MQAYVQERRRIRHKMASKFKVRKRREKVYELIIKGLKQSEISEQLKFGQRTIARDYEVLLGEKLKAFDSSKANERYVEYDEKSRLRIRRLWSVISDNKISIKSRLRALDLLRKEDKEAVNRDQVIGILPKSTETQIDNVNIMQVKMSQSEAMEKFIKSSKEVEEKD